MGKLEILSEINRLVSSGLKKAAIDLLTEYLEKKPDSSFAHKMLGQIYLKSGQPRKAVFHLKKSLEFGQKQEILADTSDNYDPHAFDDDDFEYVASESEEIEESDYELDAEGEIHSSTDGYSVAGHGEGELNDEPRQYENEIEEPEYAEDQAFPAVDNQSPDGTQDAPNKPVTILLDSEVELDSTPESAVNTQSGYSQPATNTISDTADEVQLGEQELNRVSNDNTSSDKILDYEIDEIEELVEFDADEEFNGISANDDDSDEEVWDDFENIDELDDLDELDVSDQDEDLDYVDLTALTEQPLPSGGRLTREQRALQVATEVIADTDWDYRHVTLLQEIFSIKGWAATKVVIEKLIEEGATPDEIALAREIRTLWKETPKYWITFHKITPRSVDSISDDAYKQMSWSESMRLIRCFPNTPDIEEIYYFIEETYELWYESSKLRQDFKAFFKFLKYRNGSMKVTLPGDYPFWFTAPEESGYDDEYNFLYHSHSEQYRELELIGLSPERFVQTPPQEISKKEDTEYV